MKKLSMALLAFVLLAMGWIFCGCGKPVNLGPGGEEVAGLPMCQYGVTGTGSIDIQAMGSDGVLHDLGIQKLPWVGGGTFKIGDQLELQAGNPLVVSPNVTGMYISELGTVLFSLNSNGQISAVCVAPTS